MNECKCNERITSFMALYIIKLFPSHTCISSYFMSYISYTVDMYTTI